MRKLLLSLGATAVALSAAPADARHARHMVCVKARHGHCLVARAVRPRHARHVRAYRVGYVFGPNYAYTPVTAIPRPVVVRYRLNPDYRYVYSNGYVYVVDPTTYAVTRVLNAIIP